MDVEQSFKQLLKNQLIPDFCTDNAGGFLPSGFDERSAFPSISDMADFLRAWDGELVKHLGCGKYRAALSGASEQFFWSGSKTVYPRSFTLWLEPIITLGVLARLHFDLGWPRAHIGTQSAGDWAFDVVATSSEKSLDEFIGCEVKKSVGEIDRLLKYMSVFAERPDAQHNGQHAQKNAYKKIAALRKRKPSFLWLVGPERYEFVFL